MKLNLVTVDMDRFHEAWWFLHNHRMNAELADHTGINWGLYDLDIFVTKVDPSTMQIRQDNHELNTEVQIWLEFGPVVDTNEQEGDDEPNWKRTHDPNLDCGAATFEDAIIELADRVKAHYGADGNRLNG